MSRTVQRGTLTPQEPGASRSMCTMPPGRCSRRPVGLLHPGCILCCIYSIRVGGCAQVLPCSWLLAWQHGTSPQSIESSRVDQGTSHSTSGTRDQVQQAVRPTR